MAVIGGSLADRWRFGTTVVDYRASCTKFLRTWSSPSLSQLIEADPENWADLVSLRMLDRSTRAYPPLKALSDAQVEEQLVLKDESIADRIAALLQLHGSGRCRAAYSSDYLGGFFVDHHILTMNPDMPGDSVWHTWLGRPVLVADRVKENRDEVAASLNQYGEDKYNQLLIFLRDIATKYATRFAHKLTFVRRLGYGDFVMRYTRFLEDVYQLDSDDRGMALKMASDKDISRRTGMALSHVEVREHYANWDKKEESVKSRFIKLRLESRAILEFVDTRMYEVRKIGISVRRRDSVAAPAIRAQEIVDFLDFVFNLTLIMYFYLECRCRPWRSGARAY